MRWTKNGLLNFYHEPFIYMKLIFNLISVILFFVAFKFLDIYVATAVMIAATITQMIWTRYHQGKVDMALWLSFVIVVIFGGATLLLHDEIFIKWRTTILFWMFAIILWFSDSFFHKNLIRTLLHEKIILPLYVWNRLNLGWSIFFAVLGLINLYVTFNYSTNGWVNFKMYGISGLMLVFTLAQVGWLTKYVNEK